MGWGGEGGGEVEYCLLALIQGRGTLIYDIGIGHRFSHAGASGERKIEKNMGSLGERLHFDPKL